jgi:hypothetical protein
MELGAVMTDTSICGLGQTAAMAIVSAQRRWPELLRAAPDKVSGNGALPTITLQNDRG